MSAVLSPHGGLSLPQVPSRGSATAASAAHSSLSAALAGGQSAKGYGQAGAGSRSTGLIVVVLLHVVIGYVLASGLARKAVEIVKKPLEAVIVTEAPPPPPPPPPKIERIKEVVKTEVPPPPAYVPPPEVVPVAPPPPVIQAVQAEPPKAPPVIAPPAPPAPEPKPAVVKQEISIACPGYQAVLAQALEEAIDRVGINGTVQTLIKVRGTQVVDVVMQSGPKEYYKYVQAAIKRMRCSAGGADEVQVALPVMFRK